MEFNKICAIIKYILIFVVFVFYVVGSFLSCSENLFYTIISTENGSFELSGNLLGALKGPPREGGPPPMPIGVYCLMVFGYISLCSTCLRCCYCAVKCCTKRWAFCDGVEEHQLRLCDLLFYELGVSLHLMSYITIVEVYGRDVGFSWNDMTPLAFAIMSNDCLVLIINGYWVMRIIYYRCFSKHPISQRSSVKYVRYNKLQESVETSSQFKLTELPGDEVKLSSTVQQSIKDITMRLWEPEKVGIGRDAKLLNHNSLRIITIKYIGRNETLIPYNEKKLKIALFAQSVGGRLRALSEYNGKTKDVATQSRVCDELESNIDGHLNECYLFHGTFHENVEHIAEQGFQPSDRAGMLGKGFYFTDAPVKADQYSGLRETGVFIFARVLIGNAVVTKQRDQFTRHEINKPWLWCECCRIRKEIDIDSLVYDGGLFREILVFESSQIFPEFAVYYRRVTENEEDYGVETV